MPLVLCKREGNKFVEAVRVDVGKDDNLADVHNKIQKHFFECYISFSYYSEMMKLLRGGYEVSGVVVRDKIQDSYHYTFIWNLNGEGWGTTDAGRRWFLVGPSEPLEPKVIP